MIENLNLDKRTKEAFEIAEAKDKLRIKISKLKYALKNTIVEVNSKKFGTTEKDFRVFSDMLDVLRIAKIKTIKVDGIEEDDIELTLKDLENLVVLIGQVRYDRYMKISRLEKQLKNVKTKEDLEAIVVE